ncbi:phospholipid N-methyltransferase [Schinkia azotoformans MEV2011]|uniref:Phospholipid N-methyltransferase n=1 Tax=Schinkia azotoformans MEV2011 TaxID=1348973 RepID=A0A072NKV8_SCHAZ|nr:methyltransferase domain-containing protein [Schinkia azotoformans]KEF38071.1 phospholipid N-methyltransferase [Schinkia azotoformans MEV2011]MEC1696634.1 methyltransferase domain-containing protein [Schinkia azotoformans]MEC1715660.1 methyltransferase domain-containing protein [Schinkia azotoformans]MEC1726108.1 methyltransferase domain-containing protein [Schinkia azotoformans]MEC1742202.1 methyltransferase domain-containing protein [Schinkia azotoformans]
MKHNETLLFLQSFIQNPKQIGSLWPSSRFLARKIAQQVEWNEISAIAELGSGTGVITREIKTHTNKQTKVFLFEKDDKMRGNLQQEFQEFYCCNNAYQLLNVINQHGVQQLDCVISGLPFFNFSSENRERLINQVVESLKPGGYFIAFQYTLQMKKLLSSRFIIESIHYVPLNFPPAFVYVCRKEELK